jgi:hypothetical protein
MLSWRLKPDAVFHGRPSARNEQLSYEAAAHSSVLRYHEDKTLIDATLHSNNTDRMALNDLLYNLRYINTAAAFPHIDSVTNTA